MRRPTALLMLVPLLAAAQAVAAVPLDLPKGARRTATVEDGPGTTLPTGPWRAGEVPRLRFEGAVSRSAWAIDAPDLSVAQISAPLESQLRAAGYEIAFDCADAACGGYDFRFAVETLPAPAMFVDLSDYRYVLATGPEGGAVAVLVSRAGDTGYVHVTRAEARAPAPAIVVPTRSAGPDDLWETLSRQGHAPLDDLLFSSGSASLGEGSFASLEALADGLEGAPGARIALVGHTDTSGALDGNIALSRRRAEAVRRSLIDQHGVDPSRIEAEGVGYLAPRTSNRGAEGRRANRRVEVVLVE